MITLHHIEWGTEPISRTSSAGRAWIVEGDGVYLPTASLKEEIHRLTPSNDDLTKWARRKQSDVPQRWFDEANDPFRGDE